MYACVYSAVASFCSNQIELSVQFQLKNKRQTLVSRLWSDCRDVIGRSPSCDTETSPT